MRIILKDEEKELEITDEEFNSSVMWIKLTIREIGSVFGEAIELRHEDLMAALIAFDAKQNKNKE